MYLIVLDDIPMNKFIKNACSAIAIAFWCAGASTNLYASKNFINEENIEWANCPFLDEDQKAYFDDNQALL